MINAKELRIGNKFKGMEMIQTVFEIIDNTDRGQIIQRGYENLITCEENGNQYKPIEIRPVPLTKEWLLKFGYRQGSMKNCYFKEWGRNGVEIIVHDYHYKGGFEVQLSESKYKSVESVHQLQNLYFALTGEELTIQDK